MAAMEALRQDPQWEYPLETLKRQSPSLKDGISFEDELIRQSRGVRFIAEVCEQLHLPAVTIYTAVTYFHRFYTRFSHKKVHCFDMAGACIFLASKVEETARRLKEVAICCTRIALKKPKMQVPDDSKDLLKWMDVITYNEELLLEALYFDLENKSPYAIIKTQLEKTGLEGISQAQQAATQFINDSCKTVVQSIYQPEVLAAAGIMWAVHSQKLEPKDHNGQPWYQLLGFDKSFLVESVNTMVDMLTTIKRGEPIQYEKLV